MNADKTKKSSTLKPTRDRVDEGGAASAVIHRNSNRWIALRFIHPTLCCFFIGVYRRLMSPSGMVEIPRLQAKQVFAKCERSEHKRSFP
ncbi:MAG: hypothetical protein Q7R89_00005, partial [bacterium]|nr:hypothetical protein [bacterium]